jgi:hypothetical protein
MHQDSTGQEMMMFPQNARKEDKNVPAEKGDATVQEVFEIY